MIGSPRFRAGSRALGGALLLALLPAAAVPAAVEEKEFRGRRILLAGPPRSQLAARHPVRAVGTEVRAGGSSFPAAVEKGRLRVAAAPGATPAVEVVAGKPVRFEGETAGEKRSVQVTFAKDGEAGWIAWASEAVRFAVAGEELRLYDCDADGRFGDLERDGWSVGGADQVLPLGGEIVLGANAVTLRSIDPDGGRIVAAVAPVAGSKSQVAALLRLNSLRAANGLSPAGLDADLSAGCTAHARYLSVNSWSGRSNPHEQNLGPRGASPEGAASAARSVIAGTAPEGSIVGFWRTYYHRIALMGPALDRIGVNADPPDLAVVDVARGYGDDVGVPGAGRARAKEGGAWPWAEPAFVPSDGSEGLPTGASGELPKEPVPDLGSRGTPLMAVFRPGTTVTAFAGTLEEVRGGAAVKVPVLTADPGHYPFARGIVPEKSLRGRAAYRATFTWRIGDREERRTIRFRTE